MKILSTLIAGLLVFSASDKIRIIQYQGKDIKTTYAVNSKFYGTYSGRKTGKLVLNEDGSGTYTYDIFGPAPTSCKKGSIGIEWGFLIDENDNIVSSAREYGLSYPILLKSTGATQFQGCRKKVMLDFIMEYKDGNLGVSSSDDWIKN